MAFRRAVKQEAKLRLALAGPAGSGKTYTALALASALADGMPVAVVDTERGSASKYADLFEFDVMELENFHPQHYVQAIAEAAQAGYGVIVLDSLSHAWNGKGGILEIVGRKGNNFQAWGEVKPIENALIEAITSAQIHVVATMRSKTEYVVETNEKGKSAPRKIGTAPVQRDGMEYEFDIFGELDQENTLTVQKTRCPALAGAVVSKPDAKLAKVLRDWLSGAPAQAPAPAASMEERKPAAPSRTQATPAAKVEERHDGNAADDPWQPVRTLAADLGLSDAARSAIFTQHKRNRDAILKDLQDRKAKQDRVTRAQAEDAAMTFEAMNAAYEADDDGNGDPDLLKKVPGLRGAPAQ